MYLAKLFVEPFSSGTFVELFVNDCGLGDVGAQILVGGYAFIYNHVCVSGMPSSLGLQKCVVVSLRDISRRRW